MIYCGFEDMPFQSSSLQTTMDISYQEIVDVFGPPNDGNDGYKTDVQWRIWTPFGMATIYNYKTGKNYLGDEGEQIPDIRDWHIGGVNKDVVAPILKALKINY